MKNHLINDRSYKETNPDSFVHLHLHTQYSLLDGAIRLNDLFEEAKAQGVPAVACTDHGNMFGAIDFYTRALKAGVKPILGSEVYFTPGSRFDRIAPNKSKALNSQDEMEGKHNIHHLVLLCKNNTGYKNLCKLLSKAYLEGFYYKPRIDIELLKEFSEGLIATTACLKGEVAYNIFTGQDDRAFQAVEKLSSVFGDDFYLEIQENGLPEQVPVNKKLIEFAQKNNLKLVATNDCHYMTPADATAQEVLLCVQTGKTFQDENRMKMTSNEFYFKSAEQMREAFSYIPEACDNTLEIADKCNVEIRWEDDEGNQIYHLPDFEIDTDETPADYFARQAREGLERRFNGPHFQELIIKDEWEGELKKEYYERLEEEIGLINQMGFAGYFLIVSDFIKWAKENGIPVGPGRGSGAGSLVAYSMDITNINPLPYNLLFERFINPERISMPDFDVDFCQDRRSEVIEYVTQKYGVERVGQIITFGKLQAKAVLRDVSRVYGLAYAEADALAKLVPDELGISLQEAIDKEPKIQELIEVDTKIRKIIDISLRLEGLLRHASIHAAGVIITNEPLVNYCPLYKGREGEQVVQFDKDFSEKIGLVKFDFLGLKTLTVIDNASKLIQRDSNPDFDIEAIDMNDEKIFDFISDGNTTGVFQLESSGMKDLCKRLKPDSIDDITAINALYRPGPMGLGMHDEFIEIKHGRKPENYAFAELEPILKDTYGIIVYQEQVMNISRIIGGYSLGQADMLRRAMGKKKEEEMNRHREIFKKGASERGFDVKIAEDLFNLMAEFAKYGFNKSHAVAYAVIAYQTAFLKYYHTAAFYAALLGTEMNNSDKVTAYIGDARSMGLDILPPDVNESLWLFNVIGDETIRFGMGAIKNVGEGAVAEIVKTRQEKPFEGFIDFCERVNLKLVNKRVIESLIKVGGFDDCEQKYNRKTLLENMEFIIQYSAKKQEEKSLGQSNLFDMGDAFESTNEEDILDLKIVEDFVDQEKLSYESELLGIYVSGHPLEKYTEIIKELSSMSISKIQSLPTVERSTDFFRSGGRDKSKRNVTLCGLITGVKSIISKKGDRMAFATFEDLTGKMECIFFPKTYAEYSDFLVGDEPVLIEGTINLAEDPKKLFPMKVQYLKDGTEERVSSVRININANQLNDFTLPKIKQALLSYKGSVPIDFIFNTDEGRARIKLGEDFTVNPTPKMAAAINEILNENAVTFFKNTESIQHNDQ